MERVKTFRLQASSKTYFARAASPCYSCGPRDQRKKREGQGLGRLGRLGREKSPSGKQRVLACTRPRERGQDEARTRSGGKARNTDCACLERGGRDALLLGVREGGRA